MSTSSGATSLAISRLNKSYGNFEVIKDLELLVERGAIHGLVGLNGSGKTTTLECILGLQPFNSGSVELLGFTPDKLQQSRGKIVAVFDSPSLHPNLTVRQSLDHAALLCETPVRSPAQVEALLGIEKFSNFKTRQLSLGNKRRASIAQALIGSPDLFLLDEPFNGLDAEGVDDVLRLITTLNREEGTSFLLSSHQLPYLEQICSHIAILHQGSIAVSNDIGRLLDHSSTTVQIGCQNPEAAIKLLKEIDAVSYLHTDAQGYLHVELKDMESTQLNQELICKGVLVSELILQRASLDSLFRQITSSEGAT